MGFWKLDDAEWEALGKARFSTNDADMFRNATVILMRGVDRSKIDIALDLGCSPATVDKVRKRYRQGGLKGLQRPQPPGRTSRATPRYRAAEDSLVASHHKYANPLEARIDILKRCKV